jgi:hypothetical protein
MRVLIFEDNLMWGPRLNKSVAAFGHEPSVVTKIPTEIPPADLAIVNLSSLSLPPSDLIPRLKEAGIKILAHAGHKEKESHALGKDLGCDRLVTNGEITHKLEQILLEF